MNRVRLVVIIMLSLCMVLEAKKTLILAIPLAGVIDFSNIINANDQTGALYNVVKDINDKIIHPLNQAHGQRRLYSDIQFQTQSQPHMTIAYIGYLPEDSSEQHDSIIKELKQVLERTVSRWIAQKSNKAPLKCSLDKVIWPPIGKDGRWLSYGVQVEDESKKDMLNLINTISDKIGDFAQDWYGPFNDLRTGAQITYTFRKSIDKAKLHVSLAKFRNGYGQNKTTDSVFGLPPSQETKKSVDDYFGSLPPAKQPHFSVNELVLYLNDDEEHKVQEIKRFSLVARAGQSSQQ